MRNTLGGSSAYHPDGVIDVGIIVVSIFKNPLREEAVKFLRDVLLRRRRAAIPVTAILGAFHIATRYLKLPTMGVREALLKMLETRSPAFLIPQIRGSVLNQVPMKTRASEGYSGELLRGPQSRNRDASLPS
jgi:hypothetical protein